MAIHKATNVFPISFSNAGIFSKSSRLVFFISMWIIKKAGKRALPDAFWKIWRKLGTFFFSEAPGPACVCNLEDVSKLTASPCKRSFRVSH